LIIIKKQIAMENIIIIAEETREAGVTRQNESIREVSEVDILMRAYELLLENRDTFPFRPDDLFSSKK
jgi:hypothetical protein